MKILIISDEESKKYWEHYEPGVFDGIDLILSCGDLNSSYLTFIVTLAKADLIYVHGNHDAGYEFRPPEGCICAEDNIIKVKGIRILGLGGAMKYKESAFMFTEKEMRKRVHKLWFTIWKNRGFDILLTHAPLSGFHDGPDYPHLGFSVFNELVEKYHPKYFIHGHMHPNYGKKITREDTYGDTIVINGYESYILEYPEVPAPGKKASEKIPAKK